MKAFDPFVEQAPITQLVSQVLCKAYQERASDIHFEPLEHTMRVRFRIDGLLHEVQQFSKKLERAILNRLKIMATSMDIAEKRLPQDGRFHFSFGEYSIDVRVATIPTVYGESMVLRLLNSASGLLDLSQLGLRVEDQLLFKKLLHSPEGLLLVTGPTGAGKSTTLYSCLKELQKSASKILTVEDPIEYRLEGVNQVQVEEKIGLTFPATLRAILRQAPNKIVIGEIRDQETAQIAMNASLTGHLVLSTLHAPDAPATIARLQEMGIAPFLIASGLRAIVAQRLVRLLCPYCKRETSLSAYEAAALEYRKKNHSIMKAEGCSQCHGKGFRGRLGIFEILILNEWIRNHIFHHGSLTELRRYLRQEKIPSLREDGILKIEAGLTTPQEVISSALIGKEKKNALT